VREVQANKDLRQEFEELLAHPDAEVPIVVSRQTLLVALRRFLAAEFDSKKFVDWTNAIELHDEVLYEPGYEKLIADTLFCLSTPEINETLTPEVCGRLMKQLARDADC